MLSRKHLNEMELQIITSMLVLIFLSSVECNILSIRKCCAKGMQLNDLGEACVEVPTMYVTNEKTEILSPPIDGVIYSWIPHSLLSHTVVVHYGTLPEVKLDTSAAFACNGTAVHKLRDFGGKIHPSLVKEERYCYDSSPKQARILVKGIQLKPIHKCCLKGQKLNADGRNCEHHTEPPQKDISQEVAELSKFSSWLLVNSSKYAMPPEKSPQYLMKVQYNAFKYTSHLNGVFAEHNITNWQVIDSEPGLHTVISYQSFSKFRTGVSEVTDNFCFDEMTKGSFSSRVLLIATQYIPKCCNKNEHLSDMASACIVRPEQIPDNSFYWLPEVFHHDHPHIRYDMIYKMSLFSSDLRMISDKSIAGIERGNGTSLPRLKLLFSPGTVAEETTHYCFDYLAGSGRVIVTHTPKVNESVVLRCDNPEEMCSPSGLCDTYIGTELPAGIVILRSTSHATIKRERPLLILQNYCKNIKHEEITPFPFLLRRKRRADWLEIKPNGTASYDGRWLSYAEDEAVASCASARNAETFGPAVQLTMAGAVVAALAIVMVLSRKETRDSAHGRALACHAFSLGTASGLQLAAFFNKPTHLTDCVPYMYATYFFMVAANWWLTAISFNILLNFRQPLGALATASGSKNTRRRFIAMSIFAWGGSIILTIFTIVMHQNKNRMHQLGVITPSFFETRTCSFQYEFAMNEETGSYLLVSRLGTLFYHCIPMSFLGCTNVVCVGLIVYTLQSLRRGRSILKQCVHQKVPLQMQSALLYVKLLMTTGVIEMILQGLTWATDPGIMHYFTLNHTIILSMDYVYGFLVPSNIIDLIRALSVFWMSTGRFWRPNQSWGSIKGRFGSVSGWIGSVRGRMSSRRWTVADTSTTNVTREELGDEHLVAQRSGGVELTKY